MSELTEHKPLSPMPREREDGATWIQVVELFRRHGMPEPPVRLRDEIVHFMIWGWYGEKAAEELERGTPAPSSHLAWIEEGIERAARYIEKKRDDYVQEFGMYDPSTGVTEFSTAGEEHLSTLEELIEGIRSLHETPTPPGNQIRTAECDGKDAVPVTGQLPVGTASPQPHVVGDLDYCFDPENWEFTCSWPDRDQVHGFGESLKPGQPMRVCTLLKGPDKWVADVPITWDEDGEPDETEIKWFDSEEEARAALSTTEGKDNG